MAFKCLLLLCALAGTQAGPLSFYENGETQCATTCPDTQKFSFAPGTTYEYRYESAVVTSIPGATEEASALHMTATARLETLSKCEMALVLDNVLLTDSDPMNPQRRQPVQRADEFKRSVERRPMRFGYVNGRVENVCPSAEEETWVVNLKRAIVSAVQNNMHDINTDTETRETDVSGTCDVSYKVEGSSWGTKSIKKSKDLLSCTGRHSADTILQAVHYDVPSKLQSVPIVRSTHECEQQVNKAGIITRSNCKETHVFRPFSRDNSGATTEAEFSLAFAKEISRTTVRMEGIDGRQSLRFDHTPSREDVQQNYRAAEETLRHLCEQTTRDVRPDTPSHFNTLVKQMRVLDAPSLQRLHQMSSSGSICQSAEKFFHDALPTISTEASVSLMAQLIRQREPDSEETTMWLNSLAFIPTATKVMLAEVKPILEMNGFERKAALAISSLVNTYCRANPSCGLENEVREIISIFERNLAYNCQSEEHDKILMSLKAIGNTGHAEQVVPTLNRCFMNEQIPMEIRVAAVSAFRRMACTADRSELEAVFRSREADSELRIGAYLSLMQCPTEFLISTIRRTLESEEVNQVGSFVWTHLTNLMETSSPFKQQARLILEDTRLQKEFDLDKRKFSRNIEKSVFSEMLNSGASMDSNLVWSTKSFVPRSASVNLTVDVFGQAINLVEVGGRVQGLDGVLERFFTPQGEEDNSVNLPGVDKLDNKFRQEREETPEGSYFVRIFGNEIRYEDFHGFDIDSVKEKFNYLQWLIELAKNHEFDYTKSTKFIDTTITLPTAVGLPLKLALDGTAVLDIKVKGKLDIRNMAAAPRSMDIDGSVKPSASIQITSEMGVDAWIAKTGLKMTNTFHTSTVADGKIQLQDGKIFKFDLNMPKERMEIFDFQSKFFINHRNADREQRMIVADRTEMNKCTGAYFEKVTGLELCSTLSYPDLYPKQGAPWFPLNGPVSASVILSKKDTYDKISFEAALMTEKDRSNGRLALTNIARLSFNTPGSQVDRELLFDFSLNQGEKNVNLNMKSPWSQAQFSGSVRNDRDMKRISTSLIINKREEYGAVAQVQMDSNTMVPTLELTAPGRAPVRLGGSIINKNGRRLIIDLTLENAASEPLALKGTLVNKKFEKMTADLELTSPWMNADLNSYLDTDKGSMDGSFKIAYQMNGGKKYRFTIDQSYRHARSGATSEINYSGSYSSTRWPGYNTDMTLKATKDANSQSLSLDGGLTRDKSKRLTINQQGTLRLGGNKAANFEGTLKLPHFGLDLGLKTDNSLSRDELSSTVKVQYDTDREGNFELALKKQMSPLKLSADAKLHYPGRQMSYEHTLEETEPKNYDHKLKLQLDAYTTLEVDSTFKSHPRFEVTGTIKTPDVEPITVEGHLKPELRDFQAKASIQMFNQPHSVDVTWQHRPTRNGFNSNAGVEFLYHSRKVESEGQLGKRGTTMSGMFETKWDALRDEKKKVSIVGEIDATSAPTMQVKATWWPREFVEVNANYKNEKTGYWSSYGDVEAHYDIKSSIRGYEQMSANVQIESQGKEHKYHYDGAWNNEKINFDSNLKLIRGFSNFEFSADLETPFEEARKAHAEYTHNSQSGQFACNSKVQWNDKEMSLDLNGRANLANHLVTGSATFKSPFKGMKTLAISGRHTDDGSNFQSELQGQWNNKKAAVGFTMAHQRAGWFIDNSGELTVTTPVYGYRINKLTWNHHNDRDEFKPHIELEIGDEKSVFEIDASNKVNSKKYRAQIKSFLNTPYIQNLRFDLNHQHERRELAFIKTFVSTQWGPNQVMELQYDVNRPSSLSWTESLKLTTPFRGYQTFSSESTVNLEGPFAYRQEIKWGYNQKMTLDMNANYKNAEFDGTATFKSPWTEVITVTADNKMEARTWVSSGSVQYAPDKKIELSTKLSNNELKRISMDFKSPCPYLETVSFDVEHRGDLKQFETKLNFNHDMLRQPISADAKFDISRRSNMQAQMNVKTPFQELPFFGFVANHQKQATSKMTTTITINNPKCQVTINDETTVYSWTNFNSVSSVEYCQKKIEFTSRLNADNGVDAMATLKTPYTEDMSFTLNHKGELSDFESTAEAAYGGYKKITTSAVFKKTGNRIQGSARVNSPVRGYETMAVNFNHRGRWYNFQNDGTVEVGSSKMTGTTEFSMRGDNMKIKATAETPIEGFESVVLDISHNGDRENFKSEGSLTYSRQRIFGSAEFNSQRDVTGKFEVRTPFRSARSFIVQFNHAGQPTNFQNSGSIQINRDTYSGSSAFNLNSDKMELRASVKVPEEYKITINHEGPKNNFNNRMTIDLAGQRIDGESKFSLDGYNVVATGTLKTPFRVLDTLTASYNYAGYPSNFQTQASLGVNRMRGNIKANFNKQNENLSGKFEMTTSFQSLRSFVAMIDHSGSLTQFENSGSLDINGQSYTGSSRFSVQRNEIQGNAVVHIPEEYKIEFSHKGGVKNWKNSVELSLTGDKITGYTSYKNNRQGLKASAGVNTPYRGFRVVDASFSHSGDMESFENSANLRINENRYSGSSQFQNTGNGLSGTVTLNLPEEYGINFNHNGDLVEFTNSGAVKVAGVAYTGRSQFSRAGGNVKGSTSVQLPDEYALDFKHEGDMSDFKSEAILKYGDKRYSGLTRFSKQGNRLSGGAKLNLPEEYGIEFTHQGDSDNFNNEGTLTMDRSRYTGQSRFSRQGYKVEGAASVNLPEEYGIEFKHSGRPHNFNNEGTLTMGRNKYTGSSRFFKRGDRIEGDASINIPEKYGLEFKHNGDCENFNNEGTLHFGRQRYTGSSRFSKQGNKVEGAANVNIPEPYGVEFKHEGELTNFNNEGKLTYNRKRFTGTSRFSKQGARLEGAAAINIPETYGMDFKHEGGLTNFNNEGTLTYGRRTYTGTSRFSQQGKRLSGAASVNIPDEYSVNFNHRGDLDSFSNDASLNLAGQRYTGETEFSKRGSSVNAKAKVNVPEEYSMALNHQGGLSDFSNDGQIKINRNSYSGKSTFKKTGSKIEGSASVNVPEEYGFQVTHMGGLKEFSNSGEVKVNRNVYSGSSEFRLDNSGVEGRASVRVPEEYALNFKHQGPLTRFNNEAAVKIPGREMSGSTEFTLNGKNVAGQASIRLPEEYGISFSHRGPMQDFTNEATIRTPEKAYTGSSEFKMAGDAVSGNLRGTNGRKNYAVEFNHEGKLNNFNNKAIVTYGNKKYSALSELLLKGKRAEGRVVVRVPDMYSIKFKHQGSLRDFSNEAMVKAINKKYTMGSEFRMDGDTVRGTANVRIPEEYKVTFSHNGAPTDFNTNAEAILDGATYTSSVAFKKDGNSIETSGQLATPHRQARSLEYRYNHQGNMYNFRQDAYAAAGNKRLSAKTEYSINGKALNGRVEVATPFQKARTVVLEVQHDGKWKNFKNSATLEVNDKRYTANGEMKLFGKKKNGSFQVNIPEEYGIQFIHKGASLTDWTNKVTASLGEEKINMNSGLTIEPTNVEAILSVRTPFKQVDNFGFSVNHKGNSKKFTTQAEVNTPIRGYKRMSGELSYEGNGRSFETTGKLQLPKMEEMNFNLNHKCQLNNYATSAAVEMGEKRIAADSAYRKYGKNLEASLNVQTPWTNYENMGFTYSQTGDKDGFSSNFKLDTPFQQYRSFGANVNHKGNRREFQSAASFQTPFELMPLLNIALNHKGDTREFASSGSVEYGTERMEGAAAYRRTSDWYDGSHIGSLRLNTPFRYVQNIDLNIEHHCGSDSKNGKVEVTYNGRKYLDGDYNLETVAKKSLVINVREPHPMSTDLSFERKNGGAEMITNFNWDTRRTTSNGRATLVFGTENGRYFSNGEFALANVPASRMSYEVESAVSSRRNQNIYDGRVKVSSALANWEGTFNHINAPGSRYITEVRIGDNRKLMVKSEILVNKPGVQATLTVGHPSYSNDVVISAEGQIGGEALFDGRASLAFADQRFEGTAKFLDKSQSDDSRYSTEWHLTHPGSFLDVTFKSEVGNSRQAVTGNMEVNYMTTRDKQIKTMSLRSEINKIRDELNMEVVTPLNNMRMTGRIMPEERGKQQFILTGNMDNQEVRAELEVNKDKPGADLRLYQNDKMIHVYGKYMDRSMVQFEAYRQVNGARIQEAQLALRLNNSQLLHARAYLRPDLMQDIQTVLEQDTGLSRAIQESTDSIADELSLKTRKLRRDLRPVFDVVGAVLEKLAEKTEIVADAVRDMYRRNTFHLRDVTDYISSMMESVSYTTQSSREGIMRKAREMHQSARQNYAVASDRVKNYSKYAAGIAYDSLAVSNKYVNDAYQMVMSHPRVQTIRDTDYWRMFEAWKARVVERISMLANEFWTFMDRYPTLKSYVVAYADFMTQKLTEMKQSEIVRMLDEITRLSYDTVRDRIVDVIKEYTQLGKTRFIVWDPSRGEFQVEIHLPLPVRDLQSLPHARIQSYIDTVKSYLSDMTPRSDWNMWDTYYAYKPTSDITDWVPPFKAHATISGNQHFMTFDKRFFEFAGECSYLLARDFIDGKFSVIVNYDKVGGQVVKKSISIASGSQNIEIFSNFKVNVNGVQTELPIVAGHTYVSREGNYVKVINDHGMKVTCDLPHDRCTIDVTGWYYGKTGGLLGTYDNEPSNDFTTAERTTASTPEELANSWTVGRKCRVANRAVHTEEYPNSRQTRLCASYYRDESSPFRKCFKQVDNEAFMHMCLDEFPASSNRLPREEDICNVASFYVEECKRNGVPLAMPSACLSCQLKSGEKFTNKTLTGSEVPQSADVVMVVSHRQCNADLFNKLDNIVSQVDSSLREQGMKKPRFSVVGFGGEGPLGNPHSHTMDGEIFNSKYKFDKAMQNFPITRQVSSEDALEALEYAARLPFRAGVSKSIILIACDTCTEQAVNYADVQRLLTQRDIRLHVLTQQDFQLKADKSTSYIFGADRDTVFTNKDVGEKDIKGDWGLRKQLRVPKDLCVALTEESSGSVFNSLKLVEGKSVGQKKFLDVLSRVVAKKGSPSECQICDCVADKTGLGQAVCKACSAPSVSRKPATEFEQDLNEYLQKPKGLSKKELRMQRRAEKRRNKE